MVSGVGNDRAKTLGRAGRFHELGVIITNLAVFAYDGDGRVTLRSIHPGVDPTEVADATGFTIDVSGATSTRVPNDSELQLIREVIDPHALRAREVPTTPKGR